jgi:hypothetical protein
VKYQCVECPSLLTSRQNVRKHLIKTHGWKHLHVKCLRCNRPLSSPGAECECATRQSAVASVPDPVPVLKSAPGPVLVPAPLAAEAGAGAGAGAEAWAGAGTLASETEAGAGAGTLASEAGAGAGTGTISEWEHDICDFDFDESGGHGRIDEGEVEVSAAGTGAIRIVARASRGLGSICPVCQLDCGTCQKKHKHMRQLHNLQPNPHKNPRQRKLPKTYTCTCATEGCAGDYPSRDKLLRHQDGS